MKRKITSIVAIILCLMMLVSSCIDDSSNNNKETNTTQSSNKAETTQNVPNSTASISQSVPISTTQPSQSVPDVGNQDRPSDENIITAWDGSIASGFAGGNGIEGDPYLISTGAQLAYLAHLINNNNDNKWWYSCYYKLTNDISLSNLEWDPIGCGKNSYGSSYGFRCFKGNFDGNGYVISDFKITSPQYSHYGYFGLFGSVEYCTIKNLGVENFIIDVSVESPVLAGGLVGCNSFATIDNCYATGDVTASSLYHYSVVGGLTGTSSLLSAITNCYATGNVSSSAFGGVSNAMAGGLVGSNGCDIKNCYATGSAKATSSQYYAYAGGLTGNHTYGGKIESCYATGTVNAVSEASVPYAGGLVGANNNEGGIIKNCYAIGDVIAMSYSEAPLAGRLVGTHYSKVIMNCYCYDGQTVQAIAGDSDIGEVNNYQIPACSLDQLNGTEFHLDMIFWDAEVWDFSDLDFANGKYPVLKSKN